MSFTSASEIPLAQTFETSIPIALLWHPAWKAAVRVLPSGEEDRHA
jgi:hypothetical protein